MSRGLGRIERAILAALHERRQRLLADRWHPLLVYAFGDRERFETDDVSYVLHRVVPNQSSWFWDYGTPLPEGFFDDPHFWDHIEEVLLDELDVVHAEPHLGEPLSELGKMMHSADNPHAVEVSVQRAAKRLEQKLLIQRCHVTATCRSEVTNIWQTRTFLCARITPTAAELADAAELRAQARQTHWRHASAGMRWVRQRGGPILNGGDPDGYERAAIEWLKSEAQKQDDWKWLAWFGKL